MKYYLWISLAIIPLGCKNAAEQQCREMQKYIGNWEIYDEKRNSGTFFNIYCDKKDFFVRIDSMPLQLFYNRLENTFSVVSRKPGIEFVFNDYMESETITVVQDGKILGRYQRAR